ncbi:hypothetical protein K435DRAFT_851156 [Dendrothele bispora CBS 962.96]|uniref:Uncharacterized protein n=1 Tax=Dendrothele bispora (strain CBS 962.96) TaxID=1314807 RepID=A0A4S8MML8_DENBC|nr:hypothetical protein K435DRAFT_851156 [Dendrothele bispora CBS 962.96]
MAAQSGVPPPTAITQPDNISHIREETSEMGPGSLSFRCSTFYLVTPDTPILPAIAILVLWYAIANTWLAMHHSSLSMQQASQEVWLSCLDRS